MGFEHTILTFIRIHGETIASPPGGDLLDDLMYPGTLRAIAFTM